MPLTLYSDRRSPMVRAVVLFMKANGVDFEEVETDFMKGDHKTNKNIPAQTLPTLMVEGHGQEDSIYSQSTTILRYLGTRHANAESWYSDLQIRFKVDEFFDLFQAKIFPSMRQAMMHTFLFKLVMKMSEPDTKQVEEGIEGVKSAMKFFKTHYLKDQKFMGGDKICIGDLLAVCCLEQMKLISEQMGTESWVKESYGDYFEKVTSTLDGYDEICESFRAFPL